MLSADDLQQKLEERGIYISEEKAETLLKLQYKLANTFFDNWKKNLQSEDTCVVKSHSNDGNCISVFSFGLMYEYVS